MPIVSLHEKDQIEKYLSNNVGLYIYHLGDLDDFFWKHTCWYALMEAGEIQQLALLYIGMETPVLLALSDGEEQQGRHFMRALLPLLPTHLHIHFSPHMRAILGEAYDLHSFGTHYKMLLRKPEQLQAVDTARVVPLTTRDLPELEAFYRTSYPENSFDPRMLETGCFYGIRADGPSSDLLSVAGIHVYSERYRVAALGNVTTHPAWRGRGLGTVVCARLGLELLSRVEHIGLNVKAENQAAIRCYERLGFEHIATYEEASLIRRA